MLVIHVCLFDAEGRLLLQHRAPEVKLWPDLWDFSAGGAADAGETGFEAARRELAEEMGIVMPPEPVRPRFTLHFAKGFDDFFFFELPAGAQAQPNLQAEEVSDARWADRDEVLALLAAGQFVPYHPDFIRSIFAMRHETGPKRIFNSNFNPDLE